MNMDGLTLQEILNSMKDTKYNHRIKSKTDLRLMHKTQNDYLEWFYSGTKKDNISITTKKPE